MHVLCFDCALSTATDDDTASSVVPAVSGQSCPICGSANPFEAEDIVFAEET